MVLLGYLFAFAIGSAIGSFLNVCIYRLPRDLSIVSPPSHCTWCNELVRWYDNIPVLSYFALNGRCRHCGTPFSIRYPAIEAVNGLVFVYLAHHFYLHPGAAFEPMMMLISGVLCSALLVVSAIDIERQIIPDEITLSGLVIAPVFSFIYPQLHKCGGPVVGRFTTLLGITDYPRLCALVASLLGMAAAGGFIYVTGFIGTKIFRKEAMGFGDVKLMAMMGGFLGWAGGIAAILVGCIFGAVIGIAIWIFKRESRIPFGPYLSLGCVTVLLFSPHLKRLILWWQETVSGGIREVLT